MAPKYLLAVIGIAFLAITIQTVSSNPELGNPVQDLIKELMEHIQDLVKDGIKQFQDAFDGLMKTIKGITESFSKAARAILGPIADEISKISDTAISAGINITECAVEESLEELENLPTLFQEQMEKCLDTLMKEANDTLADGEKQLNDVIAEVQELADQAGQCGFFDPLCWSRLAGKVAEDSVKIPGQVAQAIATTIKLFTSMGASAWKCQQDTMHKLSEMAHNILTNVTECIENKMSGTTEEPDVTSQSVELF